MAIFDRSYDRDYGYRGGSAYRGEDRGLGDRMRHGWDRLKEGARDAVDRDDDRGYGYRGGAYGSTNYDRDFGGNVQGGNMQGGNWGRGTGWQQRGAYDRDLANRDWSGGRGMLGGGWSRDRDDDRMGSGGAWAYDRDFDRGGTLGGSDMGRGGYDRDYKSRWQTDNGDPFGDRASRTPIRMMRGGFRNNDDDRGGMDRGTGYDVDYGRGYGAGSSMSYDRDLMNRGGMDREQGRGYMHGLGYDPYDSDDRSRGGWGMGNRNRGYDRGWF